MKSQALKMAALLGISGALMPDIEAPLRGSRPTRIKRVRAKSPITKKIAKRRAANKVARKSRKINRQKNR